MDDLVSPRSFVPQAAAMTSAMLLTSRHLDLGHGGPTSSYATTAEIGPSAPTGERGKDQRPEVSEEAEPHEGANCLRLVAAFAGVVRTARDTVVVNIRLRNESVTGPSKARTEQSRETHFVAAAVYA